MLTPLSKNRPTAGISSNSQIMDESFQAFTLGSHSNNNKIRIGAHIGQQGVTVFYGGLLLSSEIVNPQRYHIVYLQ
jgi:hypothetical protein